MLEGVPKVVCVNCGEETAKVIHLHICSNCGEDYRNKNEGSEFSSEPYKSQFEKDLKVGSKASTYKEGFIDFDKHYTPHQLRGELKDINSGHQKIISVGFAESYPCFFCNKTGGEDIVFDIEFDTPVHISCIRERLDKGDFGSEASHMIYLLPEDEQEVYEKKKKEYWDNLDYF